MRIDMEATDFIPREKFNLWYGLFRKSGGRLLENPIDGRLKVYVNYCFDDMNDCNRFHAEYYRLTKNIIETKRGWWKKLSNRLFNPSK